MPEEGTLKVRVVLVDENQNCRYYDEIEDPGSPDEGEIYRNYRSEYGRCAGHVYMTTKERDGVPIGWVFVRRVKYDDSGKIFLRTAWVTLVREKPAVLSSVELKKGKKS